MHVLSSLKSWKSSSSSNPSGTGNCDKAMDTAAAGGADAAEDASEDAIEYEETLR
jgi:hypothetical protein